MRRRSEGILEDGDASPIDASENNKRKKSFHPNVEVSDDEEKNNRNGLTKYRRSGRMTESQLLLGEIPIFFDSDEEKEYEAKYLTPLVKLYREKNNTVSSSTISPPQKKDAETQCSISLRSNLINKLLEISKNPKKCRCKNCDIRDVFAEFANQFVSFDSIETCPTSSSFKHCNDQENDTNKEDNNQEVAPASKEILHDRLDTSKNENSEIHPSLNGSVMEKNNSKKKIGNSKLRTSPRKKPKNQTDSTAHEKSPNSKQTENKEEIFKGTTRNRKKSIVSILPKKAPTRTAKEKKNKEKGSTEKLHSLKESTIENGTMENRENDTTNYSQSLTDQTKQKSLNRKKNDKNNLNSLNGIKEPPKGKAAKKKNNKESNGGINLDSIIGLTDPPKEKENESFPKSPNFVMLEKREIRSLARNPRKTINQRPAEPFKVPDAGFLSFQSTKKQRKLYSPTSWMTSEEFASMTVVDDDLDRMERRLSKKHF